MSWLLSRGYADKSTLKLVGDRYALTQRQRLAVMRSACSDTQLERRLNLQVPPENTFGRCLVLDGYNILITVEAALAGGVLLLGRDGCIRDLASIHGSYRKVTETLPAIKTIARTLTGLNPSEVIWLLDKPVSNSGRLKKIILDYAGANALGWQVQLVPSPDRLLTETDQIVATSDSAVISACVRWLNLPRIIIDSIASEYPLNLLDLQTR